MKYTLERSKENPLLYICTDVDNLIVCRFQLHQFNETQDFVILEESKFYPITTETSTQLAQIAQNMGEWLRNNHYDLIF